MQFIDCLGLTQSVDGEQFARALGLEGEYLTTEQQRMELLVRLEEGAGVTVYTGPLGAPFWSLVSPEVTVRIEPDGTTYEHRVDVEEWATLASSGSPAEHKRLVSRRTPVPRDHALYGIERQRQTHLGSRRRICGGPSLVVNDLVVEVIEGEEDQARFFDRLTGLVAMDWEWDEETLRPIGLSVSDAEWRNWYLPDASRSAVAAYLDAGRPSVWHNAKADIQTQYPGDILSLVGKPIDDTIVLAYLAGESELGLKDLAEKLLGRTPMKYPGNLSSKSIALQARYACADSRNTYDLYQLLMKRIPESTLKAYYEVERPLVPLIASMEKEGSPIDIDEVRRLQSEYRWMEEALRSYCWQRWHKDVSKDKETRELLTELLGYDPGTLDQRVLSRVQEPWMDVLIGYRKIRTLRRNYLDKYLHVQSSGMDQRRRLYPRFNQAGASDTLSGRGYKRAPRTGRLSSANPNIMQVNEALRSIFVAPEGCVYWYFDYSQLELRIAASLSQDTVMLNELTREGGDLHTMMQNNIRDKMGVTVERVAAKRANFNLRYRGSADTLVGVLALERVFLPLEVADGIVALDRDTYVGYWEWYERRLADARREGGGTTLGGRYVAYPELTVGDPYARSHAERAVGNLAVQGSASDIVKRAMVQSVPVLRHFGAHTAIQVHDSVSGWVPRGKAEAFAVAMKVSLESQTLPGIKLIVDGGLGSNWSEASH